MNADADLVPVTVLLPRRTTAQLDTIASRHDSTAEAEITKLVLRAVARAALSGLVEEEPLQLRAIESITMTDSIRMLSMRQDGKSIEEIAAAFRISELDARDHLHALTACNPRAHRRPTAPAAA